MTSLDDLLAIQAVKAAYLDLVDGQDWPALAQLFTTDAQISMPGWPEPLGVTDALASYARVLTGIESVHQATAPVIRFDGPDRAHALWRMDDRLYFPLDEPAHHYRLMHGFGRYDEGYQRVDGRWLIDRVVLTRIRVDGYPSVRKLRTP
jgi:hypothetical protein